MRCRASYGVVAGSTSAAVRFDYPYERLRTRTRLPAGGHKSTSIALARAQLCARFEPLRPVASWHVRIFDPMGHCTRTCALSANDVLKTSPLSIDVPRLQMTAGCSRSQVQSLALSEYSNLWQSLALDSKTNSQCISSSDTTFSTNNRVRNDVLHANLIGYRTSHPRVTQPPSLEPM